MYLSLIFLILFSLGSIYATNITDNRLISSDYSDSVETYENSFDAIQNLIDNGHNGDKIVLNGEYYSNNKSIVINKDNLVIEGNIDNTTVLNLYNGNNVFNILSKNVTIKNLIFKYSFDSSSNSSSNGNSINSGFDINDNESYDCNFNDKIIAILANNQVNIKNCNFNDFNGIGIYLNSSANKSNIIDSTFVYAGVNNDFIDFDFKKIAIYSLASNINVNNSIFRNYLASAIIINGSKNFNISNSIFNNNSYSNGSIAIYENVSVVNIINSIFDKNNGSYGGAIYNKGILRIFNSNFTFNTAIYGGAIYNFNILEINNSNIYNNYALNGSGIYNEKSLSLNNSILKDNFAKFYSIYNSKLTVKYSENILMKAYIISGDNILSSIYSTNKNHVKINGKIQTYTNKAQNQKITLNLNGKKYTKTSNSLGIALFNIPTKNNFLLKTYKYSIKSEKNLFNPSLNGSSQVTIVKKIVNNIKYHKEINIDGKWRRIANSASYDKYADSRLRLVFDGYNKTVSYEPTTSKNLKTNIKINFMVNKKSDIIQKITISSITGSKTIKTKTTTTYANFKSKYQYLKNPYLEPSIDCESNSPIIKSIAKMITKGKKTNLNKAKAIFNAVRSAGSYDYNKYYGALDFIKTYRKDPSKFKKNCISDSQMIVALARSIGIPGRFQMKVKYLADENKHSAHLWSQLFINGKWYYTDPYGILPVFSIPSIWVLSSPDDNYYYSGNQVNYYKFNANCIGNDGFNHQHRELILFHTSKNSKLNLLINLNPYDS